MTEEMHQRMASLRVDCEEIPEIIPPANSGASASGVPPIH